MIASDNRHDSQSISYSHVMQTALEACWFVYCRKDHIEREKASVENWDRNWKFMATDYRDVSSVLSVSGYYL